MRIRKRLAACEQEQQCAAFADLARQIQPFVHRAQTLAGSLDLFGRHTHIAHFASHAAHGCELKSAGKRDAGNVGATVEDAKRYLSEAFVKEELKRDQALELLVANAIATDKPEEAPAAEEAKTEETAEEAPKPKARKPRAKKAKAEEPKAEEAEAPADAEEKSE
jgi:hypothetical protein